MCRLPAAWASARPLRARRSSLPGNYLLPGCTSDVSSNDVSGVPVQGGPSTVIAHGRAGIGVGGGFLHAAQRNTGIQSRGDEGVSESVGSNRLGDTGAPGVSVHYTRRTVPVQPAAVCRDEDRAFAALTDRKVDRPRGARRQWDGDDLAALAGDDKGPVPSLDTQSLDVGSGGVGDPQPIERQQGDQRVLRRR